MEGRDLGDGQFRAQRGFPRNIAQIEDVSRPNSLTLCWYYHIGSAISPDFTDQGMGGPKELKVTSKLSKIPIHLQTKSNSQPKMRSRPFCLSTFIRLLIRPGICAELFFLCQFAEIPWSKKVSTPPSAGVKNKRFLHVTPALHTDLIRFTSDTLRRMENSLFPLLE